MIVETVAVLLANLAIKVAAAGPLNGAKVHLFTAGPVLGPRNITADFTEATYTGYAAATVTWGTPYYGTNGNAKVEGGIISFELTADLTGPVTLLGYYVTNTAGTGLLFMELFVSPIILQFNGDSATFVLDYEEAQSPAAATLLS